jgi:hypothetical protein
MIFLYIPYGNHVVHLHTLPEQLVDPFLSLPGKFYELDQGLQPARIENKFKNSTLKISFIVRTTIIYQEDFERH